MRQGAGLGHGKCVTWVGMQHRRRLSRHWRWLQFQFIPSDLAILLTPSFNSDCCPVQNNQKCSHGSKQGNPSSRQGNPCAARLPHTAPRPPAHLLQPVQLRWVHRQLLQHLLCTAQHRGGATTGHSTRWWGTASIHISVSACTRGGSMIPAPARHGSTTPDQQGGTKAGKTSPDRRPPLPRPAYAPRPTHLVTAPACRCPGPGPGPGHPR